MNFQVQFSENKIKITGVKQDYETLIGNITCMISEKDARELSDIFDMKMEFKKYSEYAKYFLDTCFSTKDKLNKINGYLICDSTLNLNRNNYQVRKIVGGKGSKGKADLIIKDIYTLSSITDLINLEMMYAVIHDIPITKCKNCGKYFAANTAGGVYCERKNLDGKTCRQIGAKKKFNAEMKKDDALLLYEKIYQATYYRVRKAKSQDEIDELNKRLDELKNWRVKYKGGEVKENDFVKYIENYR